MRRQNFRRPTQSDRAPVAGVSSLSTPPQKPSVEAKKGKSKKIMLLAILAGVLIVVSVAMAGFFAWKYFSDDSSSEEEVAAKTTEKIVERTSMLFDLPQDEEPTVAQIQDRSKLEDQEFFSNAKNGDYLLVYEKAKLALIYRESVDKLINVGPINVPQQESDQAAPQGSVGGESTP